MKVRSILLLLTISALACQEAFDIPNGVPSVVKISGGFAFTTNGELGVDVINLNTLETVQKIFPPYPSQSIDNISLSDGFLFALDARGENFLSVFAISDPSRPELVSAPVKVQGDPFTGISAKNGNVVVSGGTTYMNFRKYDSEGKLSEGEGRFGRDRGHPDVLLNESGDLAIVSTDFNTPVNGERFGIITLKLDQLYNSPLFVSEIGIPGSGFTDGTTRPAGFPIQSAIKDDHVLVATGGGLTVSSISQGTLGVGSHFDIGLKATSIALFDQVAYITGLSPSPSLVKVDVSDVKNPSVIETVLLDVGKSIPTSIAVNNLYILIAANEAGLIVMNR